MNHPPRDRSSPRRQVLTPQLREEFLDAEMQRIEHSVHAAIGLTIALVVLFAVRDWLVAPARAPLTTVVRGGSVALGLLAIFGGGSRQARARRAIVFIYGLLLTHSIVITILPLGFRYQLTSLLIIPLGASMFVPLEGSLIRLQALAFVAIQLGLWYQAPPMLDVVAAESAMFLTTLVTYLLGVMGIRARQRQFLLERQLRAEALRDVLTGAYNRRHLDVAAHAELQRAIRHHRPLSVVVIDLDHFKRINDSHGHAVGDQVIQATVAGLQQVVREGDLVARVGGEEFVLLLPETSLEGAVAAAERVKNALARTWIEAGHTRVTWTASSGVAERTDDDATFADLLRRADACLYNAKGAGRNRISTTPIARVPVATATTVPLLRGELSTV